MATFKSTTFGKISGKFGDALATQSKATGKNYLRVASVPSNPRTEKQVEHRAKFGFINSVLRPFYPVFKTNFGGGNQGIRYGINRAFKEAIVGEYPEFSIDLTNLVFSEGGIDKAANTLLSKTVDGKLKLDWDTTVLLNSSNNDRINLVFYNENADQTLALYPETNRSVGTYDVEIPAIWAGSTIHCWMYFISSNDSSFSNSQYVNSMEF